MKIRSLILVLLATITISFLGFSGCTVTVQPTPEPGPPSSPSGPARWDLSFFYDELAPYGEWFQLQGHGWAWTPYDVPNGWRPYSNGHWVYSDYGWTWVSDYEWGWAPFHYGRWLYDSQYGWVWVPGREWAPAWVAWRHGPGWIGWAPLPPGVGIEFRGSFEESIRPFGWCFVEDRGFIDLNLRGIILPPARNMTVIRMTRNVTNYTVVQNRVVNRSLTVDQIEGTVQRSVPRYRIVDRDSVTPARDRIKGNEIYMFRRPLAETAPERTPHQQVAPKQAPATGQTPPQTQAPSPRPDPAPAPPKPATQSELLQRQEAERRQLATHQQSERSKLEGEHRKEIQQPPKGKSLADLRKEHEAERRDLEEQFQRERQQMQQRHERERKALNPR